jgi:hypothetical protein
MSNVLSGFDVLAATKTICVLDCDPAAFVGAGWAEGAEGVPERAKSCRSLSARSLDIWLWNSGFCLAEHGWLPTLKYLFF